MSPFDFIKKTSLVMAAILFSTSCAATSITITAVGQLKKEMREEEAKSVLKVKPKYAFPVALTGNDANIQVSVYVLSSGDYGSYYLLAFRDDKLFYWGYPHEFARSTNAVINETGEKSVQETKRLDEIEKSKRAQAP